LTYYRQLLRIFFIKIAEFRIKFWKNRTNISYSCHRNDRIFSGKIIIASLFLIYSLFWSFRKKEYKML